MSKLVFSGTTAKEQKAVNELKTNVETNLTNIYNAVAAMKNSWQDQNSAKYFPMFDSCVTNLKLANLKCLNAVNTALSEMQSSISRAGGGAGGIGAGTNMDMVK